MKRILTFAAVAFMAASVSYGSSVTNTVKWNVPWGDRFRERAIETLDAFETAINGVLAGTSLSLSSNKWYCGGADGKAHEVTFSGFFTTTTGGVASATTSGLAWTNATAAGTLTPGSLSVSTGSTAAATLTPLSTSVSTGATAAATLTALSFNVPTGGTVTVSWTPQKQDLVYLDASSNVVTNSMSVTGATFSATFTPQTVALNYAGTNDPTVTVTAQNTTLNYAGTNAPTVTMTAQNTTLNYAGTNAPTITLTPATATFAKP